MITGLKGEGKVNHIEMKNTEIALESISIVKVPVKPISIELFKLVDFYVGKLRAYLVNSYK